MRKIAKFRFKECELGVFKESAEYIASALSTGGRLVGFTDGSFSLIDIIKSILDKIGPSDVVVCTWSAGIKDANQVKWLIDTDKIRSFLLVTDHSYVTRQKRYSLELDNIFGKENIRTAEVHGKFTLVSNENWDIVMRHSMNLNANKTAETFEIDDNKELYEFHKEFIKHTFATMPDGFEGRSWMASDSLRSFFVKSDTLQSWSNVGKWE